MGPAQAAVFANNIEATPEVVAMVGVFYNKTNLAVSRDGGEGGVWD
jgi:hypothetical protein